MYLEVVLNLIFHPVGLRDDIWQTLSRALREDLRGIRSKLAPEPFCSLPHTFSLPFSMAFLFQNGARDDPTCLLRLLLLRLQPPAAFTYTARMEF